MLLDLMRTKTPKRTTTKERMYPELNHRNVSAFKKMLVGFRTGFKSSIGHKPKGHKDEETDPEEASGVEEEIESSPSKLGKETN